MLRRIDRPKYAAKVAIFTFAFGIIGVVLAFFLGLGWFFLMGTLLRLTYIFFRNTKMRKLFLGDEGPETIGAQPANPRAILWSKILTAVILAGWIGMTIFVFVELNVPLIEFFR